MFSWPHEALQRVLKYAAGLTLFLIVVGGVGPRQASVAVDKSFSVNMRLLQNDFTLQNLTIWLRCESSIFPFIKYQTYFTYQGSSTYSRSELAYYCHY